MPEAGEIEAMTAYEMAATVEFGLDAKQGLLDLRSENARMRLVTRLCRAALKRLDFSTARRPARARTARSTSALAVQPGDEAGRQPRSARRVAIASGSAPIRRSGMRRRSPTGP